jgi:predicted nucleic acid-binding protein
MYLADTNVISELRKGARGNPGVVDLFRECSHLIFLPVLVIGEVRYGIEKLKHKGDFPQARRLEEWFQSTLVVFNDRIIDFDLRCAQMWGTLMGVNEQHPVDKQIAAIALVYDLTVITRNTNDFAGTGVRLVNPFLSAVASADLSVSRKSH